MTGAVIGAVRLDGLEIAARGRTILGPLDLELALGEYVLLVGPSGCGKTTLLRTIAGLAVPHAGTVQLFGKLASEPGRLRVPPAAREVGFLFQGGALWPHMSVRRTLRFALSCAGVARVDREPRLRQLVEQVELAGFEERLPGTLSGGERQRLALARALAASPRLLLLDEPLGPLDRELRDRLMQTLARLHAELGGTTLHVTHDPDEASAVATRTVRLQEGRVAPAAGVGEGLEVRP